MITVEEAFEKYRQRLELSETERKDTIRRHTEVRECIRGSFQIDRDFLTGSYDRHTKTKPLKDVDIFFTLGKDEQKWRNKPPHEILDAFVDCLRKKYGKDAVDPGRRCATVEFEKNTKDEEGKVLSIDAVPAFELGDCYEIPDRDLGKWIKTDPEIHAEKIHRQEQGARRQMGPAGQDDQALEPLRRQADQAILPDRGDGL